MSTERRTNKRHRVLQRARIILPGGHSTLSCLLLDFCEDGALLQTEEWLMLPQMFSLRLQSGGPTYHALVCYRDRDRAGVRFLNARAA
jgi:hypothetical protein